MRKLTAASLVVTAVISAGAAAAAATAATPVPTRPVAERHSVDRNAVRAERDRSGARDKSSSASRHERHGERSHDGKAGR